MRKNKAMNRGRYVITPCITELPTAIRLKAIREIQKQGRHIMLKVPNPYLTLAACICFADTKQGSAYWYSVCVKYYL